MGGEGVLVFQEVGTIESLHWRCEMWFDCVERRRRAKLPTLSPASATAPRAFCCRAVVPGVLACVHMHILYVCVYICVCVYVCGHVYVYIYACVYVFVHLCVYTHVYVYVCVCVFVHRLWVSVSVLQRVDSVMHARVCSCAYVCVCICM